MQSTSTWTRYIDSVLKWVYSISTTHSFLFWIFYFQDCFTILFNIILHYTVNDFETCHSPIWKCNVVIKRLAPYANSAEECREYLMDIILRRKKKKETSLTYQDRRQYTSRLRCKVSQDTGKREQKLELILSSRAHLWADKKQQPSDPGAGMSVACWRQR